EGTGLAAAVRTIADETGGGYFDLRAGDDLASTFARVVEELRHQYVLGFAPATLDGKRHKLDVKLSSPGLKARARRTYVASLDAADRWRAGEFADRILFSRAFAPGRSPFRLEPREPIAVRERAVRGGSPLWDALHHSVELLADQPGRRSLLVFTDGRAS